MPSFKRRIANLLEQLTGTRIIAPASIGALYEAEHIRRLIESFEIDCVFDVGANAGQYAQMLRERVKYSGPIISFEPIPHLARDLRLAAASGNNWYIREVALDRQAGSAWLRVTRDSQFSSLRNVSKLGQSMFPRHVEVSDQINVVTSTLASEVRHWGDRIGFRRPYLKIDTQGNDLAVAEGAGELLRDFVAIQAELAIQKLYEDVPDLAQAISFFRHQGFEPSAFAPNNEGTFPVLLETDCIFINRKYACGRGLDQAGTTDFASSVAIPRESGDGESGAQWVSGEPGRCAYASERKPKKPLKLQIAEKIVGVENNHISDEHHQHHE
jgi:FkbM family methyltransferase